MSNDPVVCVDGEWYFWDEVGLDKFGPYPTEEIARQELKRYCEEYLGS